jgi:arsenate reductase
LDAPGVGPAAYFRADPDRPFVRPRVANANGPRQPRGAGVVSQAKPSVLFVCIGNAGRSRMAAGWLSHLAGDRVEVHSAGVDPADSMNPTAVAVMREVGVEITGGDPRKLTIEAVAASDVIVTMGCAAACPTVPDKCYQEWKFDDLPGLPVEAVRVIRDRIRQHVEELVADLLGTP